MSEPNDPTPPASGGPAGQNPAPSPDQDRTEVVRTPQPSEQSTALPGGSQVPSATPPGYAPSGYPQQPPPAGFGNAGAPNPYGQPNPYAQPTDPAQYGQQPAYGGQQYGAAPYAGQPNPYGQAQYGQGQYGQAPQYPAQQYGGQPPYGSAPADQQPAAYGAAPGYGAGQQPAYGAPGQFGAPAAGDQPASQFGGDQFSSMAKQSRGTGLRTWLFAGAGALVLIVAILLITAFWLPGWAPKSLSQNAVQDGVKQILTKDYQAADVSNVSCPSGQKVEKGNSFSCSVTIGGQQQQVKVTILDDDGKYEVSRPTS